MLTPQEWLQVKAALKCAWSLNMMGYGNCIPVQNVIAILSNYVEGIQAEIITNEEEKEDEDR